MAAEEQKRISPEDEKSTFTDLTFVNTETHIRVDIPSIVILQTKNLTRSSVERAINDGISQAMKVASKQISASAATRGVSKPSTEYLLNYTTKYLPEKKKTVPKGLCFVYFDTSEFANVFIGLNPDGSERVELYQDPKWVPQEWDYQEEVKASDKPFSWDQLDVGVSWADIQEEIDIKEAKKAERAPPMLRRELGPLIKLMGREGAEDPFEIVVEKGFSKLKKAEVEGKQFSRLHIFVPDWVDLVEMRGRIFQRFSSRPSYPILEYVRNRDSNNGHLYVNFFPGSSDGIAASMMLFRYLYKQGRDEVVLSVDFAKQDEYEKDVSHRSNYVLLNIQKYEEAIKRRTRLIPSEILGPVNVGGGKSYQERSGPQRAPEGNWGRSPSKPPPSQSRPVEDKWNAPPSSSSSYRAPPKASQPPVRSSGASGRGRGVASKPPARSSGANRGGFAALGEE